VTEEAMAKLDPLWGKYVWGLTPQQEPRQIRQIVDFEKHFWQPKVDL
jgi:hypothetical protein